MKRFLLIIICVPVLAVSQGIKFEEDNSWQQVLEKAKAQKKFIFVDCYASWCAPCKWMMQNIFPKKEAGDYFNSHFINVAIQMDQTSKDSPSIRKWYVDAQKIQIRYSVTAFPTYLFFNSDGVAVHRIVGSTGENVQDLISKAKEAFDPEKQYYFNIKNYKQHSKDSFFLYNALKLALSNYDNKSATAIGNVYLEIIKKPLTKDNLQIIDKITHSTSDKGFHILMNNMDSVDNILFSHTRVIKEKLTIILVNEKLNPFFKNDSSKINCTNFLNRLKNEYPLLASEIDLIGNRIIRGNISGYLRNLFAIQHVDVPNWNILEKMLCKKIQFSELDQVFLEEKAVYFWKRQMWDECAKAAVVFMDRYGNNIGDRQINNIAWYYVFLHCSDSSILHKAVNWSKKAVDMSPTNCQNIDTYANLLYKVGETDSAIDYEKKAIEVAEKWHISESEIAGFQSALQNMKNGKKTWFSDDNN